MYESIVFSLNNLESVADYIRKMADRYDVITLSGELGAGKTTLVKAILRTYGITEVVTSPTFTYVNCYINPAADHFYHFDLYRITDVVQFLDAGFDEYFSYPGAKCFIEWPERIITLLPQKRCAITLEHHGAETRNLIIQAN